jgi:hypothetical protein
MGLFRTNEYVPCIQGLYTFIVYKTFEQFLNSLLLDQIVQNDVVGTHSVRSGPTRNILGKKNLGTLFVGRRQC